MLKLESKFRNWILGGSERHSFYTETWMCIVVSIVLEAKRQHLLARLHCFQVLHQLACKDFGNFHHSYKGLCTGHLVGFARTQVIPSTDRFGTFASRQFKQPMGCWILGHQKWFLHTIHFLPSVADWRWELLCCIQAVFPHIRPVVSTFNVVSQAVACG